MSDGWGKPTSSSSSTKQWAAVKMWIGLIIAPPQICSPRSRIDTWWGNSFVSAFSPPTTLLGGFPCTTVDLNKLDNDRKIYLGLEYFIFNQL